MGKNELDPQSLRFRKPPPRPRGETTAQVRAAEAAREAKRIAEAIAAQGLVARVTEIPDWAQRAAAAPGAHGAPLPQLPPIIGTFGPDPTALPRPAHEPLPDSDLMQIWARGRLEPVKADRPVGDTIGNRAAIAAELVHVEPIDASGFREVGTFALRKITAPHPARERSDANLKAERDARNPAARR
jgi:hypothetical protein